MITYEDCLELVELTPEQIDAVAEHEHLDRLPALAVADHLVHSRSGERLLRRMLIDDIRHAQRRGNSAHVFELRSALSQLIKEHPLVR